MPFNIRLVDRTEMVTCKTD